MMMNNGYQVAVIGGGPAGTSTALRLARMGLDVCLLEKNDFPREVLCGEFLSNEVSRELKDLGLYDKFLALNPNRINSFRLINDDSTELNVDFSFESFAVKRSVFDNFLLKEAERSGVRIYQPAEVKNINKENGKFVLDVKDGENSTFYLKSDFVVAAYGKRNVIDKQLHRNFTNKKSGLNGIKFHINKNFIPGFIKGRVEIYLSTGIYCGLNAVSDNEITLCLLEDRNDFSGTPIDHLLRLFDKNKKFAEIFSNDFDPGNIQEQAYGTGNIYFGKRELVKDGIIMAGDAAGVIAPLVGDGIGMALQTGKIIAEIFGDKNLRGNYPDGIEAKYEEIWEENFRKRLLTAGIIQKIILGGRLKNASIRAIKCFPFVLPYLVKNTRG